MPISASLAPEIAAAEDHASPQAAARYAEITAQAAEVILAIRAAIDENAMDRVFLDSISVEDALSMARGMGLPDSVTTTEVLFRAIRMALADGPIVSDSLGVHLTRPASDSVSATDAFNLVRFFPLLDSVALVDALSWVGSMGILDAPTVADVFVATMTKSLTDSSVASSSGSLTFTGNFYCDASYLATGDYINDTFTETI